MPDIHFPRNSVSGNSLKNSLITGTLLLTLAGVLTRIIGFFYRIFLSRLIGAEGLGIYQLLSPVMALGSATTAAGIQTAISRFVSSELAQNNPAGARLYFRIGLFLSLLLSAATGFVIWKYADFIGVSMLGDVRCIPLLKIISLSFVPCCIHACINGYYYGRKRAVIPAISQILEQVIRVAGVWLVADIQMQRGQLVTPQIAVWGILFGELASSLYSVTMICFFSERTENKKTVPNPSVPPSSIRLTKIAKDLCSMAVPLTCSRILLSLCQSAEALLIPIKLRDFGYTNSDALSVYGILTGMVFSTIMFPCVLSNSLSVMLLPAIAEANSRKQYNLVQKAIRRTTQLCVILGLVCTSGFLLCGNWIGIHLFHNTLAGIYVRTLSWICPFLFLASTLCSILHGLGKATLTMLINLAGAAIRIIFVVAGIPRIGLSAYLWGMLASQILICALAFFCLHHAPEYVPEK